MAKNITVRNTASIQECLQWFTKRLANNRQQLFYNMKLGKTFMEDCNYVWKKDMYSHHRFYFHKRCILILERLITTGKVDFSKCTSSNIHQRNFAVKTFELIYNDYIQRLQGDGIKKRRILLKKAASQGFVKLLFSILYVFHRLQFGVFFNEKLWCKNGVK